MQYKWAQICIGAAMFTPQTRPQLINLPFNGGRELLKKLDTPNRCVLLEISHLVQYSILKSFRITVVIKSEYLLLFHLSCIPEGGFVS